MAYTDIDKSDDYFNTVLYTGTNSALNLTVGFQPDMYWIKCRDNAHSHVLGDAVRGIGNGTSKVSYTDLTSSEGTCASGQGITGVTSTQLQLGSETNTSGSTNGASKTYVAWNWLASNSSASNTDGSITSTVSANTTSGFSIVSYTGTGSTATIGHGLGVTPAMIIVKDRTNSATSWVCWNKNFSNLTNDYIILNNTDAKGSFSNYWGTSAPTSSVFGVGSGGLDNNKSSANIIAYCFAEKKGFSKFGSYTGNNSNDGTFVYTGMKPAWVLIKRVNSAANWILKDNKRDTYNFAKQTLLPNSSGAEYDDSAYNTIDFLSNGFKLRGGSSGTGNDTNASEPYIYMCFAESPFTTSTGIPTTAR